MVDAHDMISEYRVLKSAAGYYVGEQYWDDDMECWLPYDRLSGYFATAGEAALELSYYIQTQALDDTESRYIHLYQDCLLNEWGFMELFMELEARHNMTDEEMLRHIFGEAS